MNRGKRFQDEKDLKGAKQFLTRFLWELDCQSEDFQAFEKIFWEELQIIVLTLKDLHLDKILYDLDLMLE